MGAEMEELSVSLADLLLDPRNYRFQDLADYVAPDESRYHEDAVQKKAALRLREDSLIQLKQSILRNGLLPIERIIVVPYDRAPNKYVVVEGNRRVAALKWIMEDDAAGITAPEQIVPLFEAVPVVVIRKSPDQTFLDSLLGVRHVAGIKEWGGYQRAKLVAVLRDQHHIETLDVAERIGMTAHEVNRRYRAFKALQQMQNNDDFADFAKPELYFIFHEAVSLPAVKGWLEWDEDKSQFREGEHLERFYRMITPREDDEGRTHLPRIRTREETRQLRMILEHPDAKRVLLDEERTFLDALTVAKREELSRSWPSQLGLAKNALESIGALELKRLTAEEVGQIERLVDVAQKVIELYRQLNPDP